MEILISLNSLEPPAGNVRLVPGHDLSYGSDQSKAFGFAGWLGLLRALYEVIGSGGETPNGRRMMSWLHSAATMAGAAVASEAWQRRRPWQACAGVPRRPGRSTRRLICWPQDGRRSRLSRARRESARPGCSA